jgi:hypothetical protein
MHTKETTLLPALIKAHKEVNDYRTELASVRASELPKNYDAVVISEWLGHLASEVASDHACTKSGDTITEQGIDSVAGFLASFWETHHLLTTFTSYEKAVRKYFDHADQMLAKAIEDASPTPSHPVLTEEQLSDLAEKATHSLFATIQSELDPKGEHDLGGWSAVHHEETFEAIQSHARKVAKTLAEIVRNA